MKLLYRLVTKTFVSYGFILNQYIVFLGNLYISEERERERNMLIADKKFIRSLVKNYRKHTVYTPMVVLGMIMKHAVY